MVELERVLADPKFRCSERNKRFLRYVTEQSLEDAADKIKAYSIAVDVFGRPVDFDPITDPIVRIEAMRLRSALSHYYELYAQQSLLRLDLPKGGYVPTISRRFPSPQQSGAQTTDKTVSAADCADDGDEKDHPTRAAQLSRGSVPALIVSGISLVAFGFWQFMIAQAPMISQKPQAVLTVSAASPNNAVAAHDLKESLFQAVSRFQTLTLASGVDNADHFNGAKPAPSVQAQDAAYEITMDYRMQLQTPLLWWQIKDRHGLVLVSRVEPIPQEAGARDQMVGRLANHIAGIRGTISNSELRRDYAVPTLGNGCVLRAYRVLHSPDPGMHKVAKNCLERTIRLQPAHSAAHAALSELQPMFDVVSPSRDLNRHALNLANAATVLSPRSSAAARAQMEALFRLGHIDAAISAGQRALSLNPYDDDNTAALARVLMLSGRWQDAKSLIENAVGLAEATGPEIHAVLAMDAYRSGAYGAALAHVVQSSPEPCCEVAMLHLAALGQLDMVSDAQALVTSLQKAGLGSEAAFYNYMTQRQFDPAFTASLQEGIAKLGLPAH